MPKRFTTKPLFVATCGLLIGFGITSLPSLANGSDNLREGLPGRRISGGVRHASSTCFTNFNQSLVAMMPRNNLGKTAEAHPTFWFSVPQTKDLKAGTFQLFNESDDLIYTAEVDISHDHGLSEFQLPTTAPALVINTNYRWVFSVTCNNTRLVSPYENSSALGLQGWVRRIELSEELRSQLKETTPENRVSLYASAGLWHEQVSELVNLRRRNLNNPELQMAWTLLTESNGLMMYISNNILEQMTIAETAATEASLAPTENP
ncbi:MAG: DUF928 domain-containing protein [Cyanobacteria bacterium J06597_16]